jgi:pimeloyl-ACP methyl ester carboxylesterase
MTSLRGKTTMTRGYAPVNSLKMYYEIEGSGDPLVYIPPAFGCAGMKAFPSLGERHSVITIDLQAHGRTVDIPDRPLTLERHAKDVAGLLKYLGISKADFFGESYGGGIATLIAVACRSRGNLRSDVWPSTDCRQSGNAADQFPAHA